MASVTGQLELDRLAGFIHDDILQSLGVCVLEAELSRRFASRGQRAEAVAELDGGLAALQAAIEQSRGALVELRQVAPWLTTVTPEPHSTLPSSIAAEWVQPDLLVRALDGCLAQAELCRDFYRRNDDDAAFEALGDLLDRLDEVATAFRRLMSELRRPGVAH